MCSIDKTDSFNPEANRKSSSINGSRAWVVSGEYVGISEGAARSRRPDWGRFGGRPPYCAGRAHRSWYKRCRVDLEPFSGCASTDSVWCFSVTVLDPAPQCSVSRVKCSTVSSGRANSLPVRKVRGLLFTPVQEFSRPTYDLRDLRLRSIEVPPPNDFYFCNLSVRNKPFRLIYEMRCESPSISDDIKGLNAKR